MAQWKIDPTHSEVIFKVKHLLVSTVTGKFASFDATIETSQEDFSDAVIRFEADVKSINTGNTQRDAHLASPDFFDAANHDKIAFVSTGVTVVSDHEMLVKGKLTMRGMTRDVTLNVINNGTVRGFAGNNVAGFEITGKVNRFDYGLQWNTVTEVGGVVVSNEVKIEILAEFTEVLAESKAA